jgi:hypothetical protein
MSATDHRKRAEPAEPAAVHLQRRLGRLADIDPDAADWLRTDLLSGAEREDDDSLHAEAFERVRAWLTSAGSPDVIIVPGTGDGPEVGALLRLLPGKSKALLLERVPARAARLFAGAQIETWVEQGRLALAFGEDRDNVERRLLSILDVSKSPTLRVFDLVQSPPEDQAFFSEMLLHIRGRIRTKIFNLGTLIQHGLCWQINTLLNLPALLANPGVNALQDLFPGRPALVVAAGPSLNETLETLKAHSNRFVVIATGTALRPLRKAGIIPDLVVAVDASPLVARQFETECDDLYLACSSMVCPDILGKVRGVFSGHVSANPVGLWLDSLREKKGAILGAGTVTATAMDLAVRMGCNPVLTVGLDLCVADDGTTHADNTMYHGVRKPATGLHRVPANSGGTVLTTNQFRVYIDAIGDYARGCSHIRFININTGGAAIKGMELERPERIAAFAGPACEAPDAVRQAHAAFRPDAFAPVAAEIRRVADELAVIVHEAVSAAMLCNGLIMHIRSQNGDSAAARADLEALRLIDEQIMAARESSLLIEMSLRAVYYSAGAASEETGDQDARGVLANRRSRELYEQIASAANVTRAHLLKLADDLDAQPAPPGPAPSVEGQGGKAFKDTSLKTAA